MQITFFKGTLPVNLPDAWFHKPARVRQIRWAKIKIGGKQAADFRPVGGPVIALWVSADPETGRIIQHCEELHPEVVAGLDWGASPFSVCSRQEVAIFGQSGTVLDLTHL